MKRYENEKEAIKPITIMTILLNENSLITDAIMEELTIYIICYLRDYYKRRVGMDFRNEFMAKFSDNTRNFFELIGSHLGIVLKSLG